MSIDEVWQLIPYVIMLLGYVVGRAISFREAKQKAYAEIPPPILKEVYSKKGAEPEDEVEFCKALIKLWLYGSKKVAKKMDYAVWILQDVERRRKTHAGVDNLTEALQEAIAAMRADIQPFSWLPCRKLKPEDIKHIYTWLKKSAESGVKTGVALTQTK